MKLGAEPKKLLILVGLLVVAVVVYFINAGPSGDSGYTPPTAKSGVRPATPAANPAAEPETRPSTSRNSRSNEREFRPSLRPRRGEARPDPTTVDPTLRLDVLAKLRELNVEGSHRSIFDFGQAPPPKPTVTEVKGPKAPNPLIGPEPPKPAQQETASAEPPKPQAPPVPMKFFGYISAGNQPAKRAFFVEGEDIHVVREGDIVKNRYKIVRIGVNSVVVEDLQFKSQQTVPLLEEQPT